MLEDLLLIITINLKPGLIPRYYQRSTNRQLSCQIRSINLVAKLCVVGFSAAWESKLGIHGLEPIRHGSVCFEFTFKIYCFVNST